MLALPAFTLDGMTSLTDEERWNAWCADFDEVEKELYALFHTRWMFRTITGMLKHSEVQQYTTVQNYILRTYVATVCTAVRREADADQRTTSLARCLRALVECPHFANRARYAALVAESIPDEDPTYVENAVDEGFRLFAPGGGDYIDADLVTLNIERLLKAAAPVKKYTNQVLAHRERQGKVRREHVSFDQINHALNELSQVARHYYLLRHPGVGLMMFTPSADLTFLNMFKQPWYRQGYETPDETTMG